MEHAHGYICTYIYIHGYYPRIPKQYGAIDLERLKDETMLPQDATWIIKEATRYIVKGRQRKPQSGSYYIHILQSTHIITSQMTAEVPMKTHVKFAFFQFQDSMEQLT